MEKISKDALMKKIEKNEVTVVEVLKEEEYKKAHIKGAINIPLERIGKDSKERFLRDEPIVVYCSDYECTASPDAGKKLETLGFRNVYHYAGGKKEWRESGLPMQGTEVNNEEKS